MLSVMDVVVWGIFAKTTLTGQKTSDGASHHLKHLSIINSITSTSRNKLELFYLPMKTNGENLSVDPGALHSFAPMELV